MSRVKFGPRDLLEYNAQFSVLICRECQYAIQKSAVESHLLRHKIYRGDRQRLLDSLSELHLLEPDDVDLPTPGTAHIDALPVLEGYRCLEPQCGQLTASSKRIKRHWSQVHGLSQSSVPLLSVIARSVKMQTFFRGTKVRYFEVLSSEASPANDEASNNDQESDDGRDNSTSVSLSISRQTMDLEPAPKSLSAHVDLDMLTYFHSFSTRTGPTLPSSRQASDYWQTDVIAQALQQKWLMCGVLALSACHLAVFSGDAVAKQVNLGHASQFYLEFSTGRQKYIAGRESRVSESPPMHMSRSIGLLLQLSQTSLTESSLDIDRTNAVASAISAIRGLSALTTTTDIYIQAEPISFQAPSVLINHLRGLPFRMVEVLGRPEIAQNVVTTIAAIDTLIECCSASFASEDTSLVWQSMSTWLQKTSDHFDEMVQRQDPGALIVLAHWAAILVKRAERVGCWYLKCTARLIVLHVTSQLSAHPRALGLVEKLVSSVED